MPDGVSVGLSEFTPSVCKPVAQDTSRRMLMTPLTKALLTVAGVSITGVLATVAGLSVEGFLGIIVALNGIELALIVANTARISNLSGRYDADHD